MKRTTNALPLLAVLLIAANAGASEADLTRRVTQQDGWVAYQVQMTADAGTPCCYEWHHGKSINSGCDLDARSWNLGTNDDDPRPLASDRLDMYLHVSNGRIDKLRAYGASCAIRNADKVRRLDTVAGADSVALLATTAAESTLDLADTSLASLAFHADAAATRALEQLIEPPHPRKLREQALFWLGQARGADGAKIVERVATSNSDDELREQAIFALSQSHAGDPYASILRIARRDRSERVREQALFWMAQTGDKRAKDDIVAAIGSDASEKVREQGVFALSQLKDDQADAALIALVRGNYPRKVKEQALFWLGQSGSTRALDFLDEVLTRQAKKTAG